MDVIKSLIPTHSELGQLYWLDLTQLIKGFTSGLRPSLGREKDCWPFPWMTVSCGLEGSHPLGFLLFVTVNLQALKSIACPTISQLHKSVSSNKPTYKYVCDSPCMPCACVYVCVCMCAKSFRHVRLFATYGL